MLENRQLNSALYYHKIGHTVIPTGAGEERKKPYVRWAEFQQKASSKAEILKWWTQYPDANPALICGKNSGIMVIDCDTEDAIARVEELLPDDLKAQTPTALTPKGGRHYYFEYQPGLVNRARPLPGIDIRTDGGYVLAPSSKNSNGSYRWLSGHGLHEVEPQPMPSNFFNILKQACSNNKDINTSIVKDITNPWKHSITNHNIHNISFSEGGRDETIFHVANCLNKGGMHPHKILELLYFIGSKCSPPFPEKEINAKFESALKRHNSSKRNLTAEVREWIGITWGNISITDALQNITNITNAERPKITTIMNRLVKEGLLERVPGKNGVYRKVDYECDAIDFLKAESKSIDIWLPFNLHEMVESMPGNIILLAGETNAGKTGLLFNIIRANMRKFDVHYFNSEMGAGELKKRLSLFKDITLDQWKFKAWERSGDFADVIKSGEGKINIIDFLEIHDNFYEIGGRLAEIHSKLKGAIAIVALQKNRGTDMGLGGFRSLEKPRLALAMSPGVLKIVKAKNWKNAENPNGKEVHFKIVNGCDFIQTKDWHKSA